MDKSSGGIGVLGALTFLFIGLKLGGAISWPWLWVLCPLWIIPAAILGGLAIIILSLVAFMLMAAVLGFIADRF